MPTVADVVAVLEELAPPALAAGWDNVGLLWGDAAWPAPRVLTCLTLTPDVAAEAIAERANLIVSHHPVLFRPVQRVTAATSEGKLLLDLAAARIAVYSPHTGYDSAASGINQQLAESLSLNGVAPLRPESENAALGSGRYGTLDPAVLTSDFVEAVKRALGLKHVQYVGRRDAEVRRVAIACGSAGEFLDDAHQIGCDTFVTGETRFHTCLEARTLGMTLVLIGHYASERPGIERLAETLAGRCPELTVWASRVERDPLDWA